MTLTTATITTALRKVLPAIAASFPLALAMGALFAWRNPQHPTSVAVTVMAACTWPIIAIALQILWFERSETNSAIESGRADVETAWFHEAAATAFWATMGGLLFLDSFGSALKVAWLSPVGLAHAMILGIGSFGLSYLWLRRRDR